MQNKRSQQGFTLIEIMVSTVIFAVVVVSSLSLFNYVLKINRRSQALSQASDGMRNFVEFLVKEIQNGRIDYYTNADSTGGQATSYTGGVGTSPCMPPSTGAVTGISTYSKVSNWLGIINTDNLQECFYYGDNTSPVPNYVGPGVFSAPNNLGYNLMMQEQGVSQPQVLNPSNIKVQQLRFLVRPICDPYTANCSDYGSSYPKIQPVVTILIQFIAELPTGEQVPIYYETSVSSNKYDIPNQ